jgi:hypothetical protein
MLTNNKTVVVILAALVAGMFGTTLVITESTVHASIFGNFTQGYNAGKSAALAALNSGRSYDASCPVNYANNISYCTGYHSGYYKEWEVLRGVPAPGQQANVTNAGGGSGSTNMTQTLTSTILSAGQPENESQSNSTRSSAPLTSTNKNS